jgi:type I restriction enzyme, R subunit
MSVHLENAFEKEVCEYLGSNGWLYQDKTADNYDRKLALYPPDLTAWLEESQKDAWDTYKQKNGSKAEANLLQRIREQLDQQGTLDLLRNGIEVMGLPKALKLAEFKPALGLNPEILARYNANRLRVVRQVRYSLHNENSIDLVLFLNGIPVATVELKTDNTQSIDDAVWQYKTDRLPKLAGKTPEPLLSFPSGALVHFAVSCREVRMTTKLAGPDTVFLPFNKGSDPGGKNCVPATLCLMAPATPLTTCGRRCGSGRAGLKSSAATALPSGTRRSKSRGYSFLATTSLWSPGCCRKPCGAKDQGRST